jgi:hypothetical protein
MGAAATLLLGALLGPLGYTMSNARSSAGKAHRAGRVRR